MGSKPIETQEKAELNNENEELVLEDAVKDKKDSGHHHFEVKHVGSNSKLIETSKDKDFDSSIDEKLEKIEADRVKEKKADVEKEKSEEKKEKEEKDSKTDTSKESKKSSETAKSDAVRDSSKKKVDSDKKAHHST